MLAIAKPMTASFISSFVFLYMAQALSGLIFTSRVIDATEVVLAQYNHEWKNYPTYRSQLHLIKNRALRYEKWIEAHHLLDGMVVGKNSYGQPVDVCDSLLFSSLRYVSLRMLGFLSSAAQAWEGMESSKDTSQQWLRHPRCANPISRDMMMGLLISLFMKPPHYEKHLLQLKETISEQKGFMAEDRGWNNFSTPNFTSLLGQVLNAFHLGKQPSPGLPFDLSDFEIPILGDGYRLHLLALRIWLRLQIKNFDPTSVSWWNQQRDKLSAYFLFQKNPKNLFFLYLRLVTSGLWSGRMKEAFVNDLSVSRHFPEDHLPQDCDRKADYLWQRSADEYLPNGTCSYHYPGVDFLWIVALVFQAEPALEEPLSSQ